MSSVNSQIHARTHRNFWSINEKLDLITEFFSRVHESQPIKRPRKAQETSARFLMFDVISSGFCEHCFEVLERCDLLVSAWLG